MVSRITDMRKSIDGLSLIVADVLEMESLSCAWFIFCNRGRDKIKILFSGHQWFLALLSST
ncbi:IS66 family insertion sequence element accessory protein TnpB (plasmid) [Photobacterium leiognathi subsp. mandapamensis]